MCLCEELVRKVVRPNDAIVVVDQARKVNWCRRRIKRTTVMCRCQSQKTLIRQKLWDRIDIEITASIATNLSMAKL